MKENMYPPLTNYYNRLKAIMERDPAITMELDYKNSLITIDIDSAPKAAAWREILPETKTIGSVTFDIVINNVAEPGANQEVILAALTGNTAFSRLEHIVNKKLGIDRWFCYMQPEIIQFPNDNFGSPESLETRTAEDLIREVLELDRVSICSESMINE